MKAQKLISLPPAMASAFAEVTGLQAPEWFATSDPPEAKLGSGGGAAHLLIEAWRTSGEGLSLEQWLEESPKLLLMAGGQSRRLPAYAASGKLLLPMPVLRWSTGQRLDQTLLDLQLPYYEEVLRRAFPRYCVMLTSGDVFLRFDPNFAAFPVADVLGLGMWVRPEAASDFGVFFSPRSNPNHWQFFLQKPTPARIRELASDYFYLVDTGMWLLSLQAVMLLLEKCGWDRQAQTFRATRPNAYEIYSQFGLSLGSEPTEPDAQISQLAAAILPLPDAEFYHLGTSQQLIESVSQLQNLQLDQTKLGSFATRPHPDQYILNSDFRYPRRLEHNHTLWVENSCVPETWSLCHHHILTGIPKNDWDLVLEANTCLDFVPIGKEEFCIRFYGFFDSFRGWAHSEETKLLGHPLREWLERRGIALEEVTEKEEIDIQFLPLFPVLPWEEVSPRLVEWLTWREPRVDSDWRRVWLNALRLSAEEIPQRVAIDRLCKQRRKFLLESLPRLAANHRWNPFYRLDLAATAELYAESGVELPTLSLTHGGSMDAVRHAAFCAAVLRRRHGSGEIAVRAEEQEQRAFGILREQVLEQTTARGCHPRLTLLEDQILWARSPARIDLAGGWTDTPPHCLFHGGAVLNFAANLNGQQPIQVFVKSSSVPQIVLRSIDLGVESLIRSYEEIADFSSPHSEFSLAKAALALAGFLPRFQAGGGYGSLLEQLEEFGAGLEITLLSAIPKGSGLGTSSILAATLLAALSESCGLGWELATISARTLALEQLLTTGGGWQDQLGGITRGIKLIETEPGFAQTPRIRWLPEHLLTEPTFHQRSLLYYTGLTRMAKNILREIVWGMFLNNGRQLQILREIHRQALALYEVLQSGDWVEFCRGVGRAWELKQQLDSGTNPPAVQEIITRVAKWTAAVTMPGAGGGGYLLFLAHDEEAATAIRRELELRPPNGRARFVEVSLSASGVEITRS